MQNNIKSAVLKTISYAAVFKYPLTVLEIHNYLIGNGASYAYVKRTVNEIPNIIRVGDLYTFRNHEEWIAERNRRQVISEMHKREAFAIAYILGKIPGIQCIGISGSLSMNNSTINDDIDFFIITRQNQLWVSRFLSTIVLKLLHRKRGRNEMHAKGKVCTNMWLAENEMKLKDRNLYTAHEIAQVKVLVNKNQCYQRFIRENQWIYSYLPNSNKSQVNDISNQSILQKILGFVVTYGAYPLEIVCYSFQVLYMRRVRTTERISKNEGKFHPHDVTSMVLRRFRKIYNKQQRQLYNGGNSIIRGRFDIESYQQSFTPGS